MYNIIHKMKGFLGLLQLNCGFSFEENCSIIFADNLVILFFNSYRRCLIRKEARKTESAYSNKSVVFEEIKMIKVCWLSVLVK